MTWLIITLVVAGIAWWWFYQSKKPYYHRNLGQDRFEWLLKTLLETLKDESVLMIEHQGSDRFIQFVKTSSAAGRCLGFGFPDAPWSRAYFEPVCTVLEEHGFEPSKSKAGDENIPRFVEVEFIGADAQQIAKAVEVAQLACQAVGLGESDRYTAHFRGELDSKSVIEDSWRAIREARSTAGSRHPVPAHHPASAGPKQCPTERAVERDRPAQRSDPETGSGQCPRRGGSQSAMTKLSSSDVDKILRSRVSPRYFEVGDRMVAALPELSADLEDYYANWKVAGEPGAINLTDEILVPFVGKCLEEGGAEEILGRAFGFVEELASDLEAEIRDVAQEVVNCLASNPSFVGATALLGPKTRTMLDRNG